MLKLKNAKQDIKFLIVIVGCLENSDEINGKSSILNCGNIIIQYAFKLKFSSPPPPPNEFARNSDTINLSLTDLSNRGLSPSRK